MRNKPTPGAGRSRLLPVFGTIFLPILLLATGCSRQAPAPVEAVRPVKTIVVSAEAPTEVRVFPGKVEASNKVQLAFQVSGLLASLPVREGQTVKKGDVVARLRTDEFQARLAALQGQLDRARATLQALRAGARPEERQRLEAEARSAEAQLVNAEAEFNRSERLLRTGAISRADHDRATSTYRVAQENFESARQLLAQGATARPEDLQAQEAAVRGLEGQVVEANLQLEDATLLAPYDGVIAQRFVQEGQTVRANDPIVKFQDVDEIEIVVDVPEAFVANDMRSADIMNIAAEFSAAPGRIFPAIIKEIAQRADPTTQTFAIRAGIKAPPDVNLLPGMTGTVAFTYHRATILGGRISTPLTAIIQDAAGAQAVWVVEKDGGITRHVVKIGEITGGNIEILEGLQPGQRIAVAGVTFLREGMKVRDLGDALGSHQP